MRSTLPQSGRNSNGRFAAGNPGGPGNPHAARVSQLRATLLDAVTEDDIREVVQALIDQAKDGNVMAAREILDRCLGKSLQAIQVEGMLGEIADGKQQATDDPQRLIEMHDEMVAGGVEPPPAFRMHVEQLLKRRAEPGMATNQ